MKFANIQLITGRTVAECAALCDAEASCKGFEFGVAYGGSGTYNPGDCQLSSSVDTAGCDGAFHNLDFYSAGKQKAGLPLVASGTPLFHTSLRSHIVT